MTATGNPPLAFQVPTCWSSPSALCQPSFRDLSSGVEDTCESNRGPGCEMSAALDLCDGIACGSARIVTAENGTRPATESFTSSGDLDDANTRGELPVDDDDNLASADEEVELSMSARLRLVRNRQVGKSLANEGRLHEEGALLAIPPPTRYTRKRK